LGGVARAAGTSRCEPTPPGIRVGALAVSPGGRTIWTADTGARTITAYRRADLQRSRAIDVHGAPVDLVIRPDGHHALVTTAFYDHPGLAIVDLRSGEVDHVDVAAEPGALALNASGRRAYVVGRGAEGTLTRVDAGNGKVHAAIGVGAHPRGVALHPDGRHALVALNGEATVAVVDLRRGKVSRRIKTAAFPSEVAISGDGMRALVTHSGYGADRVTPLDLEHWRARKALRTGLHPAGVSFNRSGSLALVSCVGDGTVTVLDGHTGRRRKRLRPGGTPRALAVIGRRGLVADGTTGKLTALSLPGVR
jgi:DNA-binding beta-propeller fold protein YncE